jgi:hypothetical protein
MNHAEELIAQLRVLGRLEDFGSGARFARQFQGELSEERLHWHLRRRCFVRRLKSEVLPQLPAKRQVVVPVGGPTVEAEVDVGQRVGADLPALLQADDVGVEAVGRLDVAHHECQVLERGALRIRLCHVVVPL